jgi:hypothetical protein
VIVTVDSAFFSQADLEYLAPFLGNERSPALEEIWALMDEAWEECGCDQKVMDERVTRFYRHPVWLLNGLFIEQDEESLARRKTFTEWVAGLAPRRIVDVGGGFGTLARMIGEACPGAEIEVAEPSPHPAGVALADGTANVRYVPELSGTYDVILATDVFEHVPDPLSLVETTAAHLRLGGSYLMANYFEPAIKCHLPSTFHFRWSWQAAMNAMKLRPAERVAYGRSYTRVGDVSARAARLLETRSRLSFGLIERTSPKRRPRAIALLIGAKQ